VITTGTSLTLCTLPAARESTRADVGLSEKLDSAALSDMAAAGGRAPDAAPVRSDLAAAYGAIIGSRIAALSLLPTRATGPGAVSEKSVALPERPCQGLGFRKGQNGFSGSHRAYSSPKQQPDFSNGRFSGTHSGNSG
jgi:hypothetical protein